MPRRPSPRGLRNKFGVRLDPAGKAARTRDGIVFASLREAREWDKLRMLESALQISELKTQVRFPLRVNGELVATYVADFTFYEPVERLRRGKLQAVNTRFVVADAKGFRGVREYVLKKKLMKAIHGIVIREL